MFSLRADRALCGFRTASQSGRSRELQCHICSLNVYQKNPHVGWRIYRTVKPNWLILHGPFACLSLRASPVPFASMTCGKQPIKHINSVQRQRRRVKPLSYKKTHERESTHRPTSTESRLGRSHSLQPSDSWRPSHDGLEAMLRSRTATFLRATKMTRRIARFGSTFLGEVFPACMSLLR